MKIMIPIPRINPIAVVLQRPAPQKFVLHRDRHFRTSCRNESCLACGKFYRSDLLEAGGDAGDSLDVVDCGWFRLGEFNTRRDAGLDHDVWLGGWGQSVGEESADVFNAEAIVATVPRRAVSAMILDPEDGRWENFRIFEGKPNIARLRIRRRDPCGRAL